MKNNHHNHQDGSWSHIVMGKGTWVQIRQEAAMFKSNKDPLFSSKPYFPAHIFRSSFLRLYLIIHSGPVFEHASLLEDNSVHAPHLSSGEGRPQGLFWGELSTASPSAGKALWAGCRRSVNCGRGQEAFITQRSASVQDMSLNMLYLWKKLFLINQSVFDRVFTETTASPRAGKCGCGSS